MINQPKQVEVLYVHLLVLETTMILVLIREEDGVQASVYYTSKTFRGAEERYPRVEKMAFSLIVMT